ncbi:response regulator transcription factor [Chitinophaga sp. sic0106]|uniref:response regulator transcription factor n=1 Tax=Chitinophaga sp. sic0106 TaxID=2854785 RepID=UPI001C467E86|nr:response regulator transcription factor [Chitinophaga sp. sic0106]MBV7529755.1 response regulator transcription factor [Chitinophaga sp. sic0106]
MKTQILLIEDETDLGNMVMQYLTLCNFAVTLAPDATAAMKSAADHHFHMALIDVNLPGMDGFSLAKQLQMLQPALPFLFLTARNQKQDRLTGLQLGADDYIVKPFDAEELVLRMHNIIRRSNKATIEEKVIAIGHTTYNKDTYILQVPDEDEIQLTAREHDLLLYFFQHPNKVLNREDILATVWGSNDYVLRRSLDVFVSRFRKYFAKNPNVEIKNVYGVGFLFNIR